MATPALIGKKLPDGKIKFIELDYDGYYSWTGRILRTFYRTEKRVDALLELGNLSSIGPTPYRKKQTSHDEVDHIHCCAYIRDFGRKGKIYCPQIVMNKEQFFVLNDIKYLYENGKWYQECEGHIQDISSCLLTYYDEPYGKYPNFYLYEAYKINDDSTLHHLNPSPQTWAQLEELATREQQTFYAFYKDRLIRTVYPSIKSEEEILPESYRNEVKL